jgi:hypothetical protein
MKAKKLFPLALMLPFGMLMLFAMVGQCMLAFAADEAPPLGSSIMALFTAIKDKAVVAVIVMHVFQILRTNEAIGFLGKLGLSGNGMRVAVAVITALGFVANAWATGMPVLQALIEGLFVSGGAMVIFDALKKNTENVATETAAATVAANVKSGSLKA